MKIDEFWEVLESVTNEKLLEVQEKLLPFSEGKEELLVPVAETVSNIRMVRELIKSIISEDKFKFAPITIQNKVIDLFNKISQDISLTLEGTDTLERITNHTENLVVELWTQNLLTLPTTNFNYLRNADRLKHIEEEIESSLVAAKKVAKDEKKVSDLRSKAEENTGQIDAFKTKAAEESLGTAQIREDSIKVKEETVKLLDGIKKTETEVKTFYESANTSSSSAKAVQVEIQKFFEEITDYRKKISESSSAAEKSIQDGKKEIDDYLEETKKSFDETVDAFNDETGAEKLKRTETLEQLEANLKGNIEKMGEHITKATGYSLFHSFDTRREILVKSKMTWVKIIFSIVATTALWNIFLAYNLKGDPWDISAYLKLSVSIPLIGAFFFALAQYNKERKLEEEYAFRSNVSISLVPYKDEVAKLIDDKIPEERQKYADFVIDAIKGVYQSPTEKLFDGDDENPLKELDRVSGVLSKALGGLGDFVEKIGKVADKLRH